MKATAIAGANIALVKYWGKRDEELMLPQNGSIGVTLDGLTATTTVDFSHTYEQDQFVLNDHEFNPEDNAWQRVHHFLSLVRTTYSRKEHARVKSNTNFPTGVGLASSAAGFAALTGAVNKALNLGLDIRDLSMLARRGSGSACRSVLGGFVEWRKGERPDGIDSFAESIRDPEDWADLRIIACITSSDKKETSSRVGMRRTVETSPMYNGWLQSVEADLDAMRSAITQKNLEGLGEIAEGNCLKMHATMMTATPSIIYWNETTVQLIRLVQRLRGESVPCYCTIDAGPQVKIICSEKNVSRILKEIEKTSANTIVLKPGKGVQITDDHLF